MPGSVRSKRFERSRSPSAKACRHGEARAETPTSRRARFSTGSAEKYRALRTDGSGPEQDLAGRPPALERPMRIGCACERKLSTDPHRQPPLGDPREEVPGPGEQLIARRRVVAERRTSEEERSLLVEDLRVDRGDRPARLT